MSAQFTIRPATYEDISEILKVNNVTWNSCYKGYIPDDILQKHSQELAIRISKWQAAWQNKIGFVAEINGQIIGEATGCLQGTTEDFDCLLNTLYVNPDYQGLGIGKALFLRFTEEMKNQNKHKLEIHTIYKGIPDENGHTKLGPSISFYQKMGCQLTETYDTHPLGMVDVLMIKEL